MARPMNYTLSLVIPAYNEADNLPVLLRRLAGIVEGIPACEIIIIDDGSSDASVAVLRQSLARYPQLRFIALTRNYGHQTALRAGLEQASGDCVVCLDADLQHPPELVTQMILQWQAGADIVSCIRQEQKTLPLFKRVTSRWFYRGLSWLSGLPLVAGSSDFRLLDRKVVGILNAMPESDLFYRGIIPTLGFRATTISYAPHARRHGRSKYDMRRMVRLALTGVISTSTRPLRLATYFALCTALGALSFLAYVLYIVLVARSGVPGWASTLAAVLMLGTMQLLVLGVVGEYLGQVLKEARRRPPYLIGEAGGDVALVTIPVPGADEGRARHAA
jgi:glycosyltransferase involved in cell wall biosynthesis